MFCSGSKASSNAEAGSPWKLADILSISSKTKTGFEVPAFFKFCNILPGRAPMYVFLCPLISASSLIPPSEIRTYFLPNASAIDFPNEVFPTPGGPNRQRIGDFISFLSLRTAKYSRTLFLTSSKPK